MDWNTIGQIFGFGVLGAAIPEAIKFVFMRERRINVRYKRFQYWFLTLVLLILGGAAALAHSFPGMPPMLAIHLGATPALLVGATASAIVPIAKRKGFMASDAGPTTLELLSWI